MKSTEQIPSIKNNENDRIFTMLKNCTDKDIRKKLLNYLIGKNKLSQNKILKIKQYIQREEENNNIDLAKLYNKIIDDLRIYNYNPGYIKIIASLLITSVLSGCVFDFNYNPDRPYREIIINKNGSHIKVRIPK